MQRTNIYLSDDQLRALRGLAQDRGEPVAQLVRRAIDEWLTSQNVRPIGEEEWRRRFADILDRRRALADERDWTEAEVEQDVMAAIREVRKARAARRS